MNAPSDGLDLPIVHAHGVDELGGLQKMSMGNSRRPLDDETRRAAWTALEMLRMFQRELRHDMPLQYVTSFLQVAMEEGLSVSEYAEKAGVSRSVMSRHLLDIGERTRHHEPGFGLVTYRPHPNELRRHEVFMTAKGRALAERILGFWRMSFRQHSNNPNSKAKSS